MRFATTIWVTRHHFAFNIFSVIVDVKRGKHLSSVRKRFWLINLSFWISVVFFLSWNNQICVFRLNESPTFYFLFGSRDSSTIDTARRTFKWNWPKFANSCTFSAIFGDRKTVVRKGILLFIIHYVSEFEYLLCPYRRVFFLLNLFRKIKKPLSFFRVHFWGQISQPFIMWSNIWSCSSIPFDFASDFVGQSQQPPMKVHFELQHMIISTNVMLNINGISGHSKCKCAFFRAASKSWKLLPS